MPLLAPKLEFCLSTGGCSVRAPVEVVHETKKIILGIGSIVHCEGPKAWEVSTWARAGSNDLTLHFWSYWLNDSWFLGSLLSFYFYFVPFLPGYRPWRLYYTSFFLRAFPTVPLHVITFLTWKREDEKENRLALNLHNYHAQTMRLCGSAHKEWEKEERRHI
jgi:hypothetical protein